LSYLVDDDDDDDDDDSLTLLMTLHACQRICLFEEFHTKRDRRHYIWERPSLCVYKICIIYYVPSIHNIHQDKIQ